MLPDFKCCDKVFQTHQHFRKHQIFNHRERKCPECDEVFQSYVKRQRHIDQIHKLTSFYCNPCDLSFVSESKLQVHTESVHEETRFKCGQCDASLASKWGLKSHVDNVHTLVSCSLCKLTGGKKSFKNA